MHHVRSMRVRLLLGACVLVLTLPLAHAEVASALLREDEPLPGAPGETISSINNPVVNHAGGYAVTVNTTGSGTSLSHIWGHATGGPGTVIVTEATYGNYQQTAFESFHGFSDAGVPSYGVTATDLVSGATGLDGVFLGTMPVLVEQSRSRDCPASTRRSTAVPASRPTAIRTGSAASPRPRAGARRTARCSTGPGRPRC